MFHCLGVRAIFVAVVYLREIPLRLSVACFIRTIILNSERDAPAGSAVN